MADSPTPPDAPRSRKQPTAAYSPTPGVIIFVIGGLVILGLVAWFFYAGYRQAREVETFTDREPQRFDLPPVSEAQHAELTARLAAYAAAVEGKQPTELKLSVPELNALLASDPTLESIRKLIQIESIGTRMIARVSFPMNGLNGERFLNGVIEFTPVVKPKSGLALQTETIDVPGRTVSEGFVRLYREMNFLDDMLLKGFREHPTMGPPFQKTTSVSLKDGSVVVSYAPTSK